jgi:hypothetical protein
MTPEEREQMDTLCIRIQEEKDYSRFETLLRELLELVHQKEIRFPQHHTTDTRQRTRPWKELSGSVQKIVKNVYANQTEIVEIGIDQAENLFREIRIDNAFTDVDGHTVALKEGAVVDVTVEANAKDTVKTAVDGRM